MGYCVIYGGTLYGLYETLAEAFWFAMTNFGDEGWRIIKKDE